MPWLAERLLAIRGEHGPDSIAFYISGQLLTEDYYAVNKLAKGFLGTNNVDSNSRLCMSSAVAGYNATFGADGPPPAYADIAQASCFLILGSNTAECHPIVWARIRDRQAEGAKVIVVDPRRTETAAAADLHLAVRPGADLPLLGAMLHVLVRDELVDRDFVARHTDGFEETARAAAEWPPERAAQVCELAAEDIERAAREFAAAPAALALWSMGANQSTVGTLKNRALHNLCLAAGQIGRPGAGPLSLTGQPNAMGGRETGGLAHLLPGYRSVRSPSDRAEMARLWGLGPGRAISREPGLPATDLFEALEDGRVRAVWICATNPAVSLPDAERARAALRRADLVIVQDAYHPTETSALAHVVLPAAQWPEKEGVMTNSERRVGLLRKAIEPPGEALPDWEIFAGVARAMGFRDAFAWSTPAEVYDEFAATTAGRPCDQSGISHERLRQEGGIQWPCPAIDPALGDHPGTERLYTDHRYPTPSGRARMVPTPHAEPAESAGGEFPLVLTTGRVGSQWHTMTRTAKSADLMRLEPEPFVELHPDDARRSHVRDGDPVRVASRRGAAVMRARVTDGVPRGTAFAPFHWGALHAPAGAGQLNAATSSATDPVSRQPELKACAVRVEPAGAYPRISPARREPGRLVVVGTGMAGLAAVESVLERAPARAWKVTLVGREPERPYDRIRLSAALAGDRPPSELELRDAGWYAERDVDLRTGAEVGALDHVTRQIELAGGERLSYDALVLATGSRPLMPPIEGLDGPNVHPFRTAADVRGIRAAARGAGSAAVIGGGLLGLEAARGLAQLGLDVTVVHLVDRLMETQLDGPAARLLEREMRRLGVTVLRERRTVAASSEGLRFADGEELAADLIVVAAGIRPDVELARSAGLEVGRGVLVDDELRTSAPGVWAVGECAEHRGTVYGLWAPLLEQARTAGASIAGDPAGFQGSVPATTLKVAGVDLFAAGRHSAESDEDEEVVSADSRTGAYRKLVLRDGRLAGAILLGDLSLAPRLGQLIRGGEPVPDGLLAPDPRSGASTDPADDQTALICVCNAVQRGTIETIARDRGLRRVEEVRDVTRAASGCGGCAPAIQELLDGLAAEREAASA
jgi:ferredoxin-nitrate reductase